VEAPVGACTRDFGNCRNWLVGPLSDNACGEAYRQPIVVALRAGFITPAVGKRESVRHLHRVPVLGGNGTLAAEGERARHGAA
jgi:hypothetical protein